jgi:hypothetical protein
VAPVTDTSADVPGDRSPPQIEKFAVPGPCRPTFSWHIVQVNASARNVSIAASVTGVLLLTSATRKRTRTFAVGTM